MFSDKITDFRNYHVSYVEEDAIKIVVLPFSFTTYFQSTDDI